jgi:lycopene cyclase domain-containing protein
MLVVHLVLYWRGRRLPDSLRGMPAIPTLIAHILVALIYTTPWDNYLVATGVWYYNPELVTGIVIGWVPIEEYTFFILQPILTGLWLFFMAMVLDLGSSANFERPRLRRWSVILVGLVWVGSVILLLSNWAPATYLSITLAWALPPIMLQLAVGADILWRYRKLVFWSLVPMTLYLVFADSLAIGDGTWTIDPGQSFDVFINIFGNLLPIEEFVFFLMTNILLVFGLTLVLAKESQLRLYDELIPWAKNLRRRGELGIQTKETSIE